MGNYGLKISPPGSDVMTVTPKLAQFDSNSSALKAYQWGNLQVTTNGSGDGSATFAHNLGYAPAFFAFRKGTAQWTLLDASSYANSFFPVGGKNQWAGNDHEHIYAYADGTNFGISITGGAHNATYNFRFYILVDNSQVFSNPGTYGFTKDFGFKVSKPGFDVLSAQEYNMVYSSKYKALQHYDGHKESHDLTLPEMYASFHDQFQEEGTYVDFNHGLGYAPFFLAYFSSTAAPFGSNNQIFEVPLTVELDNSGSASYAVTGFCDATKVRISFWRETDFVSDAIRGNWTSETITVKVILFTENLAGSTNP